MQGLGFFATLDIIQLLASIGVMSLLYFKKLPEINRARSCFWGIVWLLIATLHYWILGPFSFGLIYGELDYSLPLALWENRLPDGTRFDHAYAGGVDVFGLSVMNGQLFSLEQWLLGIFPPWLGIAVHKLMAYGVAYVGAYKLSRHLKCQRITASAIAIMATQAYLASTYYTLPSGIGCNIIPLAVYLIVARQGRRYYWPGVLAIAITNSISTSMPHSSMGLLTALFFAALLLDWRKLLYIFAASFLIILAIAINWHETLYAMMVLGPLSHRGSEWTASKDSWQGFWDYFFFRTWQFREIIILGLGGVLSLALVKSQRFVPVLLIYLLFIFSGPLLMQFPWEMFALKFLKGFNFYYLLYAAIGVAVLVAAQAGAENPYKFGQNYFLLAFVLALAAGNFAWRKGYEISVWLAEGSISNVSQVIDELKKKPDWLPDYPVRVVSIPYRLPVAIAGSLGIDSLDGTFNVIPRQQGLYWQYGIDRARQRTVKGGYLMINTQDVDRCCNSYNLADYAVIDLLRIANVGFIISRLPLEGLEKIKGATDNQPPPRRNMSFVGKIKEYIRFNFNPNPLYVYRLPEPLPRIYAATKLKLVDDTIPEADFLKEVEKFALDKEALARKQDAPLNLPSLGTINIEEFTLVQNGFDIKLNTAEGGLLIANVSFLPFWQASNGTENLPLFSVNGIQMGIYVPKGSKEVTLRYKRPLVRDKI